MHGTNIMELLESAWFFRMVEQQGKTPMQRLQAIFSVTETWLAAPGMRERMLAGPATAPLYGCHGLRAFLTGIATAAHAEQPASLASQLVILLQGAIAEEIRNPHVRAIAEAGKAAQAIIAQACPQPRKRRNLLLGGIAATLALGIGLHLALTPSALPRAASKTGPLVLVSSPATRATTLNPDSIDAVLALQELIQKGVCPAPELMALPPGQVTAYMNVIQFRTPEDPVADRENIRAFLAWFERTRASQCYQPPANGHTTVAWVAG